MGLVESWVRKLSLRESVGLGLFMGLKAMREHAIMHRDVHHL